jgi:hypothetical protein
MNCSHENTPAITHQQFDGVFFDKSRSALLITALAATLISAGCGSTSTPMTTAPPPPPPTRVVVSPSTATLHRGDTLAFTATVTGQTDQTVTWSVSALGSIDSAGLYTAPSTVDGASVVVTATSTAKPSAHATATVTLPTIPFSITPAAIAVAPGATHTFSATITGLSSNQVNWAVQGTGGGTITNAGLYTAPAAIGTVHLIATSMANANYTAGAVVVVTNNPHSFLPAGDLQNAREFHTATLLANGKVLVAGSGHQDGYCINGISSAELYDPVANSFALNGAMTIGRYAQTATLLPNGKVLMTGGFSSDSDCPGAGITPALTTAELYDPLNGSFAATGSMAEDRGGHTATLLTSGKVLIVGGGKVGGDEPPFFGDGSVTAEVYDPATGAFTSTGNMGTGRVGQTATLLSNGKVLITGGWTGSQPTATAELYDPGTGTFSQTGSLTSARAGHTATALQDGSVLITGGFTTYHAGDQVGSDTGEIYNPATGLFQATGSMAVARWLHTATLLPDGTVLVVGDSVVSELYDPVAKSFLPTASTETRRSGHSATLLQNGNVLVIGGFESSGSLGF